MVELSFTREERVLVMLALRVVADAVNVEESACLPVFFFFWGGVGGQHRAGSGQQVVDRNQRENKVASGHERVKVTACTTATTPSVVPAARNKNQKQHQQRQQKQQLYSSITVG